MVNNIFGSIPLGARYMVLSALGFALMSACVKEVSQHGIPVLEIIAARSVVSLFLSYAKIKQKGLALFGNNKPLLFARGLFGSITLFFVYYSITSLPLAEATILQYLHPVFTALLATLILKEVIQRSTINCIALSMLGLVIMLIPNVHSPGISSAYSWLSIGAGVLGAFGSAFVYIIVKKLTKTDHSSVIVFYFPFVALPLTIMVGGNQFVWPTATAAFLLICVGVFTQIGQVYLTKALAAEDASKATAYSYVQVVFSILIGWLYFVETPTLTTLFGGCLIIVGSLINVIWKK